MSIRERFSEIAAASEREQLSYLGSEATLAGGLRVAEGPLRQVQVSLRL